MADTEPHPRKLPPPVEGELRVWHIPQVPMKAFEVQVSSPEEAVKVLDVLAQYDLFCWRNRVRGDYSNASGLSVFEDGEWTEWLHPETFEDIDEYALNLADAKEKSDG